MNDAKAGGRATLKQGYIKSSPVSEEIVRRVPAAPAIPSGFEGAGLPTSLGAGLTSIPIFRLSLRRREGDGLGGNREAARPSPSSGVMVLAKQVEDLRRGLAASRDGEVVRTGQRRIRAQHRSPGPIDQFRPHCANQDSGVS